MKMVRMKKDNTTKLLLQEDRMTELEMTLHRSGIAKEIDSTRKLQALEKKKIIGPTVKTIILYGKINVQLSHKDDCVLGVGDWNKGITADTEFFITIIISC